MKVPLLDLKPQYHALKAGIDAALLNVAASQHFILGPAVKDLEAKVAAYCGAKHGVGLSSGTDALLIALMAYDLGAGDEVVTTPYTFFATGGTIARVGARPVYLDIDPETFNLRVDLVGQFLEKDCERRADQLYNRTTGGRVRAIMPVHLYGQAAEMRAIEAVAARHNLAIVEDAAQAHLATAEARPVGTIGVAAATSFYPTKNLGAAGDGGAVLTRDAALAARVKRLRNGGQTSRYHHEEFGVNTRLDEMQAAILRARLAFLPAWTAKRRAIAARYRGALQGARVRVPKEFDAGHVYHLFPVLTAERDRFQSHMKARGIETLIHYPVAIPRQPAVASCSPAVCPIADQVCSQVVSLPIYPGLSETAAAAVAEAASTFSG